MEASVDSLVTRWLPAIVLVYFYLIDRTEVYYVLRCLHLLLGWNKHLTLATQITIE